MAHREVGPKIGLPHNATSLVLAGCPHDAPRKGHSLYMKDHHRSRCQWEQCLASSVAHDRFLCILCCSFLFAVLESALKERAIERRTDMFCVAQVFARNGFERVTKEWALRLGMLNGNGNTTEHEEVRLHLMPTGAQCKIVLEYSLLLNTWQSATTHYGLFSTAPSKTLNWTLSCLICCRMKTPKTAGWLGG